MIHPVTAAPAVREIAESETGGLQCRMALICHAHAYKEALMEKWSVLGATRERTRRVREPAATTELPTATTPAGVTSTSRIESNAGLVVVTFISVVLSMPFSCWAAALDVNDSDSMEGFFVGLHQVMCSM